MMRAEIEEYQSQKTEGAGRETLDAELTTNGIDSQNVRMSLPDKAHDVVLRK